MPSVRKYKLKRIAEHLKTQHNLPQLHTLHLASTASTNTLLLNGTDGVTTMSTTMSTNTPTPYTIVTSDTQTDGHGRSGRQWSSIKGEGLYMSISLPPFNSMNNPRSMGRMNILAGYCLCKNLRNVGINTYLKWPNDIILNNKKLGGLLLESTHQGSATTSMVMGIGLNINQTGKTLQHLPQGTSIRLSTGRKFNMYHAYKIVASSILEAHMLSNKTTGTEPHIQSLWAQFSQNIGEKISFHTEVQSQTKTVVTERGITAEGYIITTDKQNHEHIYTYGEVGYSNI